MLILDDPKFKKLCKRAVSKWGVPSQKLQAVGEIGEFLTELGREGQKRSSPEKVIDEIADILIMMNQMAHIYGEQAVRDRIVIKIEKMQNKLKA